jgi:alpha-galactosidase
VPARIAFIGAGSAVFTRNLCSDLLLAEPLRDSVIALMDVDAGRLRAATRLVDALIAARGLPARVEATLDRREAVTGAGYVVTTFQQGGLDAYRSDIEIPRRYGVEQCVGDTLGPGGVFRALRTIPVLLDLCADLDAVAPEALLLNYVNPMAANCWAVDRATGRPHVGLCHSVQGTSELLADWAGVPYDELRFRCAGINHQAFFLELRRGGEDLYPAVRAATERPEIYGSEPVRIDLMRHFGYFVTESSGHASEYSPYFRKSARMVEEELVPRFTSPADEWFDFGRTGGYLRTCLARREEAPDGEVPAARTHEYGSFIVEAMQTGRPFVLNGNVPNRGSIPNLPDGCCVEVPCVADANGIQPTIAGALPPQLAALNRTNINVQELVVEAALTGSREAVFHAVALDPLTAAVCTLEEIRELTAELLEAQRPWLPQFA